MGKRGFSSSFHSQLISSIQEENASLSSENKPQYNKPAFSKPN